MSSLVPESRPTPRAHRAGAREVLILVVLPLVPALLTGWLHPRRPDYAAIRAEAAAPAPGRIDLAEVRSRFPDALWIDSRPASDYAAGHVPEAISLTEDDWEAGLSTLMEKWDGSRALVVYCGGEGCHASEAVARRLRRELDFTDIHVLQGGWTAWRAAMGDGKEGR